MAEAATASDPALRPRAPAAGAVLAAIPPRVLFLFLQRYIISGLTAGAVK